MTPTRIGNVAGAIVADGARDARRLGDGATPDARLVAALAARLESLFDETWLVGLEPGPEVAGRAVGEGPVSLPGVLAASGAERVLVVEPVAPIPDVELLLALTAWPEREAVVLERPSGQPWCAIYLREVALARGLGGGDEPSLRLDALDVDRVDPSALGLEDGGFC